MAGSETDGVPSAVTTALSEVSTTHASLLPSALVGAPGSGPAPVGAVARPDRHRRGWEPRQGLWELTGLDLRSDLEELTVSRTDSLSSPGDLGEAPDPRVLDLRDLPALADLGLLSGLTALTTVGNRACPVLTDLSALARTPLTGLSLHHTTALDSLRVLEECRDLRVLSVRAAEMLALPAA
ncbi:hypothetical protein ACWF76_00605 [Streptomyces globisporus]